MDKTIDVGEVNWNATAVQYIELNKQKTEVIKHVRKLHQPCSCEENCVAYPICKECALNYPCDTIKVLNGDTNEQE